MQPLNKPFRPRGFGFFRKGGAVRQRAANSNVVPFPASRLAGRFAAPDDMLLENESRIPFGLCVVIWVALAAIGWSALDAVARLI
jgi:hypothetical protein